MSREIYRSSWPKQAHFINFIITRVEYEKCDLRVVMQLEWLINAWTIFSAPEIYKSNSTPYPHPHPNNQILLINRREPGRSCSIKCRWFRVVYSWKLNSICRFESWEVYTRWQFCKKISTSRSCDNGSSIWLPHFIFIINLIINLIKKNYWVFQMVMWCTIL